MRFLSVLVLAVALGGCAAPQIENDEQLRVEQAQAVFGTPFDYLYVPSAGKMGDAAFIAASKLRPSKLSLELAARFASARTSALRMLVTGPNDEKIAVVVIRALSELEGQRLPALTVLYLGDLAWEDAMRRAANAVKAGFQAAYY